MWKVLFELNSALLDNLIMIYFSGLIITTVFFIITVFISRAHYYKLKDWFTFKFTIKA